MQFGSFQYRRRKLPQQGFILLLLMLIVAVILIGLSIGLPSIGNRIRHDREDELIHRGAEYARAIKKFYKKTGRYPLSIDQLLNTNNVRFLRKKYKDPITGKDFKLLHMGEVQIAAGSPGLNTSTLTAAAAMATAAGGSSKAAASAVAAGLAAGAAAAATTGTTTTAASPFTSLNPSQSGTAFGSGPTFGGGPIVGVASTSTKTSFHVFNKKDHYNEWQFIYDPTLDRVGPCAACSILITGPYNGPPTFGGGQIPGAVSPSQMQSGGTPAGSQPFGQSGQSTPFGQTGGFGQSSPFGQSQTTGQPFGQTPGNTAPSQNPSQP